MLKLIPEVSSCFSFPSFVYCYRVTFSLTLIDLCEHHAGDGDDVGRTTWRRGAHPRPDS